MGIKKYILFIILILLISFASAKEKSIEMPVSAILKNDVLNLEVYETSISTCYYQYAPGEWGESCYREQFGIYSSNSLGILDSFVVKQPFTNPNGPGTVTAIVKDWIFQVKRQITLLPGNSNFFKIKYTIKNTGQEKEPNVRFFEVIDFDIPITGDHDDDYAIYDPQNDYIAVIDDEYFQNGLNADIHSSRHGMDYYTIALDDDWNDGNLNNVDYYDGDDPAIGMQYNLGDFEPNEEKTITFKIWFGAPSKNLNLYINPGLKYKDNKLSISAKVFNPVEGNYITDGTVNYRVYQTSDITTGSLIYSSGEWKKDISLTLDPGTYNVEITANYNKQMGIKDTLFIVPKNKATVNGYVYQDNNKINSANVYLYKGLEYFTDKIAYKVTSTDNGFYSFDTEPGTYILRAEKDNKQGLSFSFTLKDDITQNLYLNEITKYAYLNPDLDYLYYSLNYLMADEALLLSELYNKAEGDLAILDEWKILGLASTVLTAGLDSALEHIPNIAGESLNLKEYLELVAESISISFIEEISQNLHDLAKTTYEYLSDMGESHSLTDLMNTEYYSEIQTDLDNINENAKNYLSQKTISNDFDIERVRQLIKDEVFQINSVKETKNMLVNTPTEPIDLIFYDSYNNYLLESGKYNLAQSGKKITTTVQISSGIVAFVSGAITVVSHGAAAPITLPIVKTSLAIAKGVSIAKTLISAISIPLKEELETTFTTSTLNWLKDLAKIIPVYDNTYSFIKNEVDNPYYLNKNNIFSLSLDVDLNEDKIENGKKINYADGNEKKSKITITNNGKTTKANVLASGNWIYKFPDISLPIVGQIFGDVKDVSLITSYDYISKNINSGSSFSDEITYSNFVQPSVSYLDPHILNIEAYAGPFLADWEQEFYYVIPQGKSLSKSSGILSIAEFAEIAADNSLLAEGELTPSNNIREIIYNVPSNVKDVEFLLFTQNRNINLHVYHNNKHVGDNNKVKEIEFPSEYNGYLNNPEIIAVDSVTNNQYTIKITLDAADSNIAQKYKLFVLETPFRDAIISVNPYELKVNAKAESSIELPLSVGEISRQEPLQNVVVTLSLDSRLQVTESEINLGDIASGSFKEINFNVYVPSGLQGDYTGTITITADNVAAITVDVVVSVVKEEIEEVSGRLTFLEYHEDGVGDINGLDGASSVIVSHDNKNIYVTNGRDNAIAVFQRDLTTGRLTFLEYHSGVANVELLLYGAESITISPDNKNVYVTRGWDDEIAVFQRDIETGRLTFLESHKDGVNGVDGLSDARSIIVSPDNKNVYVACWFDNIAIFQRDLETGKLTFLETVPSFNALSITVSSDNKNVYSTDANSDAVSVFQRDTTTGTLTFLEKHEDGVNGVDGLDYAGSVKVSPDNKNVYVTSYYDHAIAVFQRDTTTGKLTFLEVKKDGVNKVDGLEESTSVTVSPDNKNVYATGNEDDAIAVFQRDLETGKLTFLEYHKDNRNGVDGLNGAWSVAVSPDNKNVYVVGHIDDAVAVFKRSIGKKPIAKAGSDQTVTKGTSVDLDASQSSDLDGTIISYEWKEDETVLSTRVSFSKVFSVGTHTITLTVTDNDGLTDTDSVIVKVTEPPTANAGNDQTVGEGTPVTLDASQSNDPDGVIVSYKWKEDETVLSTEVSFQYTFPVGEHTIILTVTDNDGLTDTDTVIINVIEITQPYFFDKTTLTTTDKFSRINIVDWNNDGNKDVIVGNNEVFFYPNVDGELPVGINIKSEGENIIIKNAAPFVVDWNDDDKKDLLVGSRKGYVYLFINEGTDSAPVFSSREILDLWTGYYSTPYVVDWNNDNKKDLLVGNYDGTITLFINIGTDSIVLENNGKIQLGNNDLDIGFFSVPYVYDFNYDDKKDLIIGSYDGYAHLFINQGLDDVPLFIEEKFLEGKDGYMDIGSFSSFGFGDWNKDNYDDLITVDYFGNLNLYINTITERKW